MRHVTKFFLKVTVKFLAVIFSVLIIIYAVAYAFISFKGKELITSQIERLTQQSVELGLFDLTPPFTLTISSLSISNMGSVGEIRVSPSILGFLTGRVIINKLSLIAPRFTFYRFPKEGGEQTSAQLQPEDSAVSSEPASTQQNKASVPVILKDVSIQNGEVQFVDYSIESEPLKIILKDIQFTLNNVYAPRRSFVTHFELSGRMPWKEGVEEGKLNARGWVNLAKKDIQATLQIEDIDGVYLYPYYSNWVDLEKARIEQAKLSFISEVQGFNNDVTAQCHLELKDLIRRPRAEDEPQEKAAKITDVVLDVFRALNQGKIVLDFTIKTKLDSPQFGFNDIKLAFEEKFTKGRKMNGFDAEDLVALPGKIIEGTFRGASDMTKSFINGAVKAGQEIGKAVEERFKKD